MWYPLALPRTLVPSRRRPPPALALLALLLCPSPASSVEPARKRDLADHILRATVQIRNVNERGSGTVIASVDGETLILTASHVVHGATRLKVEIHRHNASSAPIGLTEGPDWPKLLPATLISDDPDADVALLRVRGMVALPHVARLDLDAQEPQIDEPVSSVGIDRALHLNRWQTSVKSTAMIDLDKGAGPRLFTLTARSPEHGRSGGGLFRADGSLIGVCTGQLHAKKHPTTGVFASLANIKHLLETHKINPSVLQPAKAPAPVRPAATKSR